MRTSVSLSDELALYVAEVASSAGENDAEAIREALRHGRTQDARVADLAAETDRLQERVDELETEVKRLKREKRQILAEREEKQELARYVEDERTAAQRRREASVVARAKWWLFGQNNDDGPE